MSRCPPPQTWQKYVRNQLTPRQDRALTDHVQQCPACEDVLAGLVPPWDPPRQGSPPPPPAELVERLRNLWAVAFPPEDLTAPACWPRIEGYEIRGVLGRGGTGIVYRAWQEALRREVALKMIAPGSLSSAADVQRLLNEARNTARLRHPHIVPIFAVGEYRGLPYFVMELMECGSLAQRTAELVAEPREAARLVADAARALHHAHTRETCHRDVKPANLLLRLRRPTLTGEPGRPRLGDLDVCVSDFGLARRSRDDSGLTLSGAIIGTPGYMCPEQIRSQAPTPAGDVYGLGAVLYECLTGQPPARAATPFDTLLRTLQQEPERPRTLNSRLHRDLETVCLKCLEQEPQRRYPSAAALADDLERWLRGEPVRARPIGPLGRAWRWSRRKPAVAGLLAALLLSLLAGLAGILAQWHQAVLARRQAEASDAQAQHLLNELLPSGPAAPEQMHYSQPLPSIAALLQAETHFEHLLGQRPEDTRVRIALTNVRGSLGSLYLLRGQLAEMNASFQGARDLWEALARREPRNPRYRDQLATTCYWQSQAASQQADNVRWGRLLLRAEALWQELADEQPARLVPLQKAAHCRWELLALRAPGPRGNEVLHFLQEEAALVSKRLGEEPDNPSLRKRQALGCLVLGEVHSGEKRLREASRCWREAREHYRALADTQPGDPLVTLSRALCCCRLQAGRPTDPYYREAVLLFGQAGRRLAELARRHPDEEWLRHALLEAHCFLAVCHWKAGRPAQAEQTFRDEVRPLVERAGRHPAGPRQRFSVLDLLGRAAESFPDDKHPAALAILREAAALAERYADSPSRDLESCERLTRYLLWIAGGLCRLGQPAEALRLAEQGRRLCDGLCRAAPAVPRYGHGLSAAWGRVAKSLWELGRPDESLAAFRQAVAVQRKVVAQAPSVRDYRYGLTRCCEQLALWSSRAGDRPGAAAALVEVEKLCSNDAGKLLQVAEKYQELATEVGKGRERLSPQEQAERQRYLAEKERLQRVAKAVRLSVSGAPLR